MDISLDFVKKLREKTGAGIADCKKALMESDGDIEKAIEYLREKKALQLPRKEATGWQKKALFTPG